jgi:hypothetical protein
LNQLGDGRGGERRIERVRLESNDQAIAFLRDGVWRRRRHLERQACQRAQRIEPRADLRHPQVPGHDQSPRLAQVDARAQCGGESPGDEVDRNEPGATLANRRRRQRD